MIVKLTCCICGINYKGEYDDPCPKCGWANSGIEEQLFAEEEIDAYNCTSRAEAKRNLAKGLDKWGDPIKKNYR